MSRNRILVLLSAFVLLTTWLTFAQDSPPTVPGPPPVPEATVFVDCDAGQTLADALATRAESLTLEFTGTCAEELVITRDRLTIRGLDASATITDDPATPGLVPALLLQGADVELESFTIDGARGRGIRLQRSSGAQLVDLTLSNNLPTGLTIEESSSAHVVDVTVTGNSFFGIAAWGGSNLTTTGTIDVSGNGFVGLLLSTNSTAQNRGATLRADNQQFGVAVQLGATGQFPPLEADGNNFAILSFGGQYSGSVTLTNNDIGVFLLDQGSFNGGGVISSRNAAVAVAEDSTALLDPGTLSGVQALGVINGVVEADGTTFDGDVDLGFNAQALFDGSTTTGAVICDPTALVAGSITCPSPLTHDALRLGDSGLEQVELPELPFVQPE